MHEETKTDKEPQYYLKIFKSKQEYLVALCDAEVQGISFYSNGIEIKIKPEFYGNTLFDEREVISECKKATSINAIGNNSVKLLVKHGLVHPAAIHWFELEDNQKIGHVIMVR